MSDYKPQNVRDWESKHPTPEQLQAECERLKAENAKLTTELDAWQRTCGTRQNHIEDVEKLKAELEQAKAQTKLADRLAANNEKRVLVLRKELDRSRAENDRLRILAGESKESKQR